MILKNVGRIEPVVPTYELLIVVVDKRTMSQIDSSSPLKTVSARNDPNEYDSQ